MYFDILLTILIGLFFIILVCITAETVPTSFPSVTHSTIEDDQFPFPIFIISLDTHPERYQHVLDQLQQQGLEGTRWSAVNGYKTEPKEMASMGMTKYFSQKLAFAGCASSHVNLWRHIADNKLGWTLILEDDAHFHPQFRTLFPLYWNMLPEDALLVFPGYSKHFISDKPIVNITPLCLHGYMISEVGARYLLDNLIPMNEAVDNAIQDFFEKIDNRGVYVFNGDAVVDGVLPNHYREDNEEIVCSGIIFQARGKLPTTLNYL